MTTLRDLRKKVKKKAADVAHELGVTESSVRNWEKARTIPSLNPSQYVILLELYGTTPSELAAAFAATQRQKQKDKSRSR